MIQGISVETEVDAREVWLLLERANHALSWVNIGQAVRGPVVQYLQERVEDRFAQQGDDASGKWAPLTEATQRIRASKGYTPAGPINIRTGEMYNWLLNANGELVGGVVGEGGDLLLMWPGDYPSGELGDKLAHAQEGDPDTRTVPRPVVAADGTDMATVLTILGEEIYRDMGYPT